MTKIVKLTLPVAERDRLSESGMFPEGCATRYLRFPECQAEVDRLLSEGWREENCQTSNGMGGYGGPRFAEQVRKFYET